jgi:hypothetical protein
MALAEPDPARIRTDLEYLCSPDLDGRGTGTEGSRKAGAYLAAKMQESGLEPLRAGGFGGVTPYHVPWTQPMAGWFFQGGTHGLKAAWRGGETDWNVAGTIPGADQQLRNEYVFITAHFDHLGRDYETYWPGADDDASGTAGILEVMRLLRQASPRRTIAILGISGEEEGLLGSEAFLEDPPLVLDAIKADINLDMVGRGRVGELHIMPARREGYVTTLTRDARDAASAHGITLSAGMEDHWQDSDHYSFTRHGIPSVCFNTGLHADYHQPTDTPGKINYRGLVNVVRIVRDLALKTANAEHGPEALPSEVWQSWAWGPYRGPSQAKSATIGGTPGIAAGNGDQGSRTGLVRIYGLR